MCAEHQRRRGRRGGRHRGVRERALRARRAAARAPRGVRDAGLRPEDDGHRAGARDPRAARAHRPPAVRHRHDRSDRSACLEFVAL